MFSIADGRDCFYQWDLDRRVIVKDSSITEVHFCNRTGECSLVVEVVDGLANVPNVILQSNFDVRVFGFDGKATLHEMKFKVKPRTKPDDYIYTETEIWNAEKAVEAALQEAKDSGEFNGAPGEPGATPVKGVDYWTAADQAQIVNDVLAALPVAEEARF